MSSKKTTKTATAQGSLLDTFLTPALRAELGGKATPNGFRLADVVKSGLENPDSSIGVYAPDAEAYEVFKSLFHPVIAVYHGYNAEKDAHPRDFKVRASELLPLDPEGRFIVSTRVRVGRNLKGFPLMPGISREQLQEVEHLVLNALKALEGDLKGTYYPLPGMTKETRLALVRNHFLFEGGREAFKEGDRFLESAGVTRNWPIGRGIFHSDSKNFLVWINEEDQLRIISMEKGGNLFSVFERLGRAIKTLEKRLAFVYSKHLGYFTSCPTNLGTAMRASVHAKLPRTSTRKDFKELCASLGLSVRGLHGEHTKSEGGIFDISNKRRLGVSEAQIAKTLHAGVKKLIEMEQKS